MLILDRAINCRASNNKTAIMVGNSTNEIGSYNSKRIMRVESPVSLRGGKFDIGELGAFSFINENANIRNVEKIGRYVHIGVNVIIGFPLINENFVCAGMPFYPYRNAMFSEFSNIGYTDKHLGHMKKQVKENAFKGDRDTVIGNDVYIGDNAVIRKGCNISDGAHVLPGSYVCEDVPPYAIVGGVPANIVGYRFKEQEIKRLAELRWWEYTPSAVEDLDYTEPAEFIKGFEKKMEKNQLEKLVCDLFVINPIEKTIVRQTKDNGDSLIYRGW